MGYVVKKMIKKSMQKQQRSVCKRNDKTKTKKGNNLKTSPAF